VMNGPSLRPGWWVVVIKAGQLSGHKRYSQFGEPHPIMY